MTDRPHPLGIIDNREWDAVLTRKAELYIADHERRNAPDREPSRMHIALGILAVIAIAAALAGSLA